VILKSDPFSSIKFDRLTNCSIVDTMKFPPEYLVPLLFSIRIIALGKNKDMRSLNTL